jgi:hypothetical protein
VVAVPGGGSGLVDQIGSPTYGGETMHEVSPSPFANDAGAEDGMMHCFILGLEGDTVPQGTQEVVVDVTADTMTKDAVLITLTGDAAVEVHDTSTTSVTSTTTDPNIDVSVADGVEAFIAWFLHHGANTPGFTEESGYTVARESDLGSTSWGAYTKDALVTGPATENGTAATGGTEEWGAFGIAINEVAASGVTGDIAQTLPALDQAATGEVDVQGDIASSLPALTQDAAGEVEVTGAIAQTLPALTQSATGDVDTGVEASGASVLPALTQAATGEVDVQGSVASTLPALTQAATGEVEVQGAIASTLPALDTAATAVTERFASAASVLPALTQSADGTVDVQGEVDSVLPALTQSAEGVLTVEIEGEAASTLPALTQDATAVTERFATVTSLLPALEQVLEGEFEQRVLEGFEVGRGSFGIGVNRKRKNFATGQGRSA